MGLSEEPAMCGLCGQPMNAGHQHGSAGDLGQQVGKRVNYVVTDVQGATALYRVTEGESKLLKTDADILAWNLGVAQSSLVGVKFSCWIEPAEYGTYRSDYKLIADS